MKTFLRRWYIANQLYHLQIKRGKQWVHYHDFILYLKGVDLETALNFSASEELKVKPPLFVRWLFGKRNYNSFSTLDGMAIEIAHTIADCEDKSVNYIDSEPISGTQGALNLTARGREVYAVTYLISQSINQIKILWWIIVPLLAFLLGVLGKFGWENIFKFL